MAETLSYRERQIVGLILHAKTNKIIACELYLSQGTIKGYLFRLFQKVGVKSRTELAVWALRNPAALADPGPDTSAVEPNP
jgi:DNA-binding NarL/FixJ family response regulator